VLLATLQAATLVEPTPPADRLHSDAMKRGVVCIAHAGVGRGRRSPRFLEV
jgi:hypothetical protein